LATNAGALQRGTFAAAPPGMGAPPPYPYHPRPVQTGALPTQTDVLTGRPVMNNTGTSTGDSRRSVGGSRFNIVNSSGGRNPPGKYNM